MQHMLNKGDKVRVAGLFTVITHDLASGVVTLTADAAALADDTSLCPSFNVPGDVVELVERAPEE